jgi:cation transport ATPase
MKKKYKIMGLDCANCAAKMERAIDKIDGVNQATISFMTQNLIVEVADSKEKEMDTIQEQITKACTKIDRHVKLV